MFVLHAKIRSCKSIENELVYPCICSGCGERVEIYIHDEEVLQIDRDRESIILIANPRSVYEGIIKNDGLLAKTIYVTLSMLEESGMYISEVNGFSVMGGYRVVDLEKCKLFNIPFRK